MPSPLTLKQADKLARKYEQSEGEMFYVVRHKETGELAITRHRHLHIWADVYDVIPRIKGE